MQITQVSAFSLKQVLIANVKGIQVAGYTVRPGFSNGLYCGSIRQRHDLNSYVGF